MKPVFVAAGILALCGSGALAQVPTLPQQAPNMPEAKDVPAEKVAPGEPLGTGSTLSELRRSDGSDPSTRRCHARYEGSGARSSAWHDPRHSPGGNPRSRNPTADPL